MNSASAAARQYSPMVDEMDLGGPGEDGAGVGAGAAGGVRGGAGDAGGHAASLMNELVVSSDRAGDHPVALAHPLDILPHGVDLPNSVSHSGK